jgi:hypothetical protein
MSLIAASSSLELSTAANAAARFPDLIFPSPHLTSFLFIIFLPGDDDDKDELKDNLMRDIQDGFRQRRLPDGGFKVGINRSRGTKRK